MTRSAPKRVRQGAILELIRTQPIASQEELRVALTTVGIEATQATLSRDVRELRLIKLPGADGGAHYMPSEESDTTPALEALLPTLYLASEGTGNLLVVRTMTGGAQAVALAIDGEEWPEVLGTIAGDDTILVILRDPGHVGPFQRRLDRIAGI